MFGYLFNTSQQSNNFEKNASMDSSIFANNIKNHSFTGVNPTVRKLLLIGDTADCCSIMDSLYGMPSYFDIVIFDLGYFSNMSSNFKVHALTELLHDDTYLPIIVSENNLVYECLKALINCDINITPSIATSTLHQIDLNKCSEITPISKITMLGVQKHLCKPGDFEKMQGGSYNNIRLGQIRDNIEDVEVCLRESNYIQFDLNAIKSAEMPFSPDSSHCGLTLEEACHIMKYIGLSPEVRLINVCGLNPVGPKSYQEKIGILLWYLIEGVDQKTKLEQHDQHSIQEYIVNVDYTDTPLVFIHKKNEGRWWISIAGEEEDQLYACSASDFEKAKNNVLSDRLLNIIEFV